MFSETSTVSRGRCYVATQGISAGQLIHEETPLLCYLTHRDPLLDPIEKSLLTSFPSDISPSSCILSYRLSKLTHDLKVHSQIMGLCSHHPNMDPRQLEGMLECCEIIHRMIPSIDKHSILEIIQRVCLNAFTITDDTLQPMGIGLYPRASRFNHSCDPNATQSFTHTKASFVLKIHANRFIAKGEEILISYIDLTYPTWWRRQQLYRSYGFLCHCRRCVGVCDESKLRCGRPGCQRGYLDAAVTYSSAQYRLWLQGYVDPDPFAADSFQLPIALIYGNAKVLSSKSLKFRCLKCHSPFLAKDLRRSCSQISNMYAKHQQSSMQSTETYGAIIEKLHSLLFNDDYALLRVKSEYATELILAQGFHSARIVMESYLDAMRSLCLPSNHFPFLQMYQLGKLMVYEGDTSRGLGLIREAVDRLVEMLGTSHPLVQQANAAMMG